MRVVENEAKQMGKAIQAGLRKQHLLQETDRLWTMAVMNWNEERQAELRGMMTVLVVSQLSPLSVLRNPNIHCDYYNPHSFLQTYL